MRRNAAKLALSLTEESRARLSALARSRTAPAHHVERSAIILHLADHGKLTEVLNVLGADAADEVTRASDALGAEPDRRVEDLRRGTRLLPHLH